MHACPNWGARRNVSTHIFLLQSWHWSCWLTIWTFWVHPERIPSARRHICHSLNRAGIDGELRWIHIAYILYFSYYCHLHKAEYMFFFLSVVWERVCGVCSEYIHLCVQMPVPCVHLWSSDEDNGCSAVSFSDLFSLNSSFTEPGPELAVNRCQRPSCLCRPVCLGHDLQLKSSLDVQTHVFIRVQQVLWPTKLPFHPLSMNICRHFPTMACPTRLHTTY